jgi:hypothetical protein
MHILFIDESGNPSPPGKQGSRHFVLGGVIIPEEIWPKLAADLKRIKKLYSVTGEIKWRYFIAGNRNPENSLLHLEPAKRDELRLQLFNALKRYKAVKIISVVADIQRSYIDSNIKDGNGLYHRAYKMLTERFQYCLQDLERESGQRINGLIVCDHRNSHQDERLRELHQQLLSSEGSFSSTYANLIEGLFLAPSHYSVGIQFADIVAGAVFRKFESEDSRFFDLITPLIRASTTGRIEGYGIVRLPKEAHVSG